MRSTRPMSCDRRESLQKTLAMLCDSELKCGLFGCSITRSITELNSDSHSRRFSASHQEPRVTETHGSCGLFSLPKTVMAGSATFRSGSFRSLPNLPAGNRPATARAAHRSAPCAEFISVSGQRTDRSAPRSDMRHPKRISGHAAATVQPHAPMNRPARRVCGGRVCLLTIVT